jgi:hypothetical protein
MYGSFEHELRKDLLGPPVDKRRSRFRCLSRTVALGSTVLLMAILAVRKFALWQPAVIDANAVPIHTGCVNEHSRGFPVMRVSGGEPLPRDLNWVARVCTPYNRQNDCSVPSSWTANVTLCVEGREIQATMHSRGHSSLLFPKVSATVVLSPSFNDSFPLPSHAQFPSLSFSQLVFPSDVPFKAPI